MKFDRQLFFILVCNFIFLFLTEKINSSLSPWGINLYLYGLFILFPLNAPNYQSGLMTIFLTAFMMDILLLHPITITVILYPCVYTLFYWLREEVKVISLAHEVSFMSLTNISLLLMTSFFFSIHSLKTVAFWINLGFNSIISQIILYLVYPWYIAWMNQILKKSPIRSKNKGKKSNY